ncbi:hypothetical protein TVAG_115830 [Trichomonas vaginalis G3]|uniref:Uncharacterized protein n=1 Tax=Trichomonas vaginalis (strain ATCC PRA-98 / G3) TaxID=412133 RepID=A2EH56_TRIV3|nr:bud site selection protein 7-related family [Trichomonas vaginalis G3]EAY08024.1 hypothetical protein TVAG_115830 [Trichomonas vaginalis G3]KAI5537351.1 bud site selection protein 7-related family [Trichomonas vaginalis G3]|eukprot:XP_001320247.1 hypothetical protein [Trichomonas vaginalis G3]
MASTIENLYEVTQKNMIKERKQMCQKSGTLGPDDLICLRKEEKTLLSDGRPRNYFHCVCGLKIDTPAAFPAYLASLLSRQEKGSISKKYKITQSTCYVWDSFDQNEFVAQIQSTGSCAFKCYKIDQSESKIDDEKWNKIRLSSALRYYRASQYLLFAFFGSNPVSNSITKAFSATLLDLDEFIYIAENHPNSDELQAALAAGLILSLTAEKIFEFLRKYMLKFPTIFDHILRYIPIECNFAKKLILLLKDHMELFPEDVDVAIALMKLLPDDPIYFIVFNSIWCKPNAGIALARRFIDQQRFTDAFTILNATAFASGWPSLNVNYKNLDCDIPRKAPERGPTLTDIKLVNAPLCGTQHEYFSTIAELYLKMGETAFKSLVMKVQTVRKCGRKINNTQLWPHQLSYGEVDENNYLYDPGEFCINDTVSQFEEFDFSKSFNDTISDVQKALAHKDKIMAGIDTTNTTSALILGLRLKDQNLIKKSFAELVRTHEATKMDQMLLLKAVMLNIGPPIDEILAMDISHFSYVQQNAFEFVKALTFCIIELSN